MAVKVLAKGNRCRKPAVGENPVHGRDVVEPAPFEVRSELKAGACRLTVIGELDIATTPQLEEAASATIARGVRDLTIDLRKLSFMDSSGLRLLIVLSERAGTEGWTLGLLQPAGPPLAILALTGADKNLPFVEDPGPP
jgi:anti-anti-sigma factor